MEQDSKSSSPTPSPPATGSLLIKTLEEDVDFSYRSIKDSNPHAANDASASSGSGRHGSGSGRQVDETLSSLQSFRRLAGASVSVDGDQFKQLDNRGRAMVLIVVAWLVAFTSAFVPWSAVVVPLEQSLPGVGLLKAELSLTLMTPFTLNHSCRITKVLVIVTLALGYLAAILAVQYLFRSVVKPGVLLTTVAGVMFLVSSLLWGLGCHHVIQAELKLQTNGEEEEEENGRSRIKIDAGLILSSFAAFLCWCAVFLWLYELRHEIYEGVSIKATLSNKFMGFGS